jgi:hypothetical protein
MPAIQATQETEIRKMPAQARNLQDPILTNRKLGVVAGACHQATLGN